MVDPQSSPSRHHGLTFTEMDDDLDDENGLPPVFGNHQHIFRGFKYRKDGSEIESMSRWILLLPKLGLDVLTSWWFHRETWCGLRNWQIDVTLVELECSFSCAFTYLRDNSDCWWLDVWDWNLKPPIHGAYDSKTIQPRYSNQSQTPGNYEWKIIYSILGK
jgi:hypothetical protein